MPDEDQVDFDPDLIRKLVHDPDFIRLSSYADQPDIFRILGRTFTETWHSMLLAWLLNPKGSHELGFRPLTWFCGAMAVQNTGQAGRRWAHLAMFLDERCDPNVTPNEYGEGEYTYEQGERADVRITGLAIDTPLHNDEHMVQGSFGTLVVEQKVFHTLTLKQLEVYSDYEESSRSENSWFICGVVAPAKAFEGIREKLVVDNYWSFLDYQRLHDEVLQPVLRHPKLNPRSRLIVEDYILALTSDTRGEALVISKEQRDLAISIRNRHARAFAMLVSALSAEDPPLPQILAETQGRASNPLALTINGERVEGDTGPEFILQVISHLIKLGLFRNLTLPLQTGPKRHFISETAVHPNGNPFLSPIHHVDANVWIEMNRSRESTMAMAQRLVKECKATIG